HQAAGPPARGRLRALRPLPGARWADCDGLRPIGHPRRGRPVTAIWRLGLTGGIGSGKSTVGARLQARGAELIDADAISRATTAKGGAALPAVREVFGAHFIDEEGALHRSRMRELVFADPSARQRLEAIVHPLIAAEIARRVSSSNKAC